MDEPISQFIEWLALAEECGEKEPTAMSLATVGANHKPSLRTVLLKGIDDRGFVFYTNEQSRKGRELLQNQAVALCFYWTLLDKQVRVEGSVTKVSAEEADIYFATRLRFSQIGAWASQQSAILPNPMELRRRLAEFEEKYSEQEVPRPPFWVGYRVVPEAIEFWSKGDFRLHDRQLFFRKGGGWESKSLYP